MKALHSFLMGSARYRLNEYETEALRKLNQRSVLSLCFIYMGAAS